RARIARLRVVGGGRGRLGSTPHMVGRGVGHGKGGVEALYDRHKYQREIKAALLLWAEHVAHVAEGRESKVIPLREDHPKVKRARPAVATSALVVTSTGERPRRG